MTTNFIIIDGSYFCFYRYYALLRWWSFARSDEKLDNPFENEEFKTKFIKTFIEKVKEIPKKLKIDNPIIMVAKDCPRKNIWRNSLSNSYKENREHDDQFLGGPFFKLAHQELWEKADIKTILYHNHLEADDCIAITTEHIIQTINNAKVWIIGNDMDYLQIVSDKVFLYNLKYKNVSDSKNCTKNANCDKFCKIVCGDKSDNIPGIFKKCGIKTAIKYYNNPELFQQKLNENKESQDTYILNQKLIDFEKIPPELKLQFKRDTLLCS